MPNPNYGTSGYGVGGYGNEPVETLPIGYYQNLLSSQWRNSVKLTALLYTLLRKFDDVSQCMVQMDAALDLDNAVGPQLDQCGAVAGVGRTVPFQPTGGVSPVLDDASYRLLIKAKIAQNQWDGTIGSLYPIWQSLFPGGKIVVADQQNMTAEIIMSGAFTSIAKDMISNGLIVPRPEGVEYTYTFATLPIFGFDEDTTLVAGFDQGHFI